VTTMQPPREPGLRNISNWQKDNVKFSLGHNLSTDNGLVRVDSGRPYNSQNETNGSFAIMNFTNVKCSNVEGAKEYVRRQQIRKKMN
jgi:hypothetical protein